MVSTEPPHGDDVICGSMAGWGGLVTERKVGRHPSGGSGEVEMRPSGRTLALGEGFQWPTRAWVLSVSAGTAGFPGLTVALWEEGSVLHHERRNWGSETWWHLAKVKVTKQGSGLGALSVNLPNTPPHMVGGGWLSFLRCCSSATGKNNNKRIWRVQNKTKRKKGS